MVHERQRLTRKARHVWPRKKDPDEAPIFYEKMDGTHQTFTEKEIRLGLKRLYEFQRLLTGRQLVDAIDWCESIARLKSQVMLKLLNRALTDCVEKHNMDPARIFIWWAHGTRGYFVKSLRKHTRGKFGIQTSPRHHFVLKVRQMPLEEFFHRMYILNKIPRPIAADMRLAVHEGRVGNHMKREWAPYLCANSRFRHRKQLKWLDRTRQFDYYEARREWIHRYKANGMRASTEAREARGLPPLAIAQ